MKTKKTMRIKTTTKTIFILTTILFFGLCFNFSDFNFNNNVFAVIFSDKLQMDTNLSESDASFIGEDDNNLSGMIISSAGDVNNDGYDDFLIAANSSPFGTFAGQTYLILGKEFGWQMDVDLSHADASFVGESVADISGFSISSAGDVNNDGLDDFLIVAKQNIEGCNKPRHT